MNSSNMIKVIAAFVGGIVVALGSALIYVKAHDRSASHQALVQTAPPASDTATLPDAGSLSDAGPLPDADRTAPKSTAAIPPDQVVPPKQVAPPARKAAPRRVVNSALGHRYRHNGEPAAAAQDSAPVQIAQNTPPEPVAAPPANPYTAAAPAAVPAPAVEAATPPPAPARQPRTMTIPAGTNLSIRLGEKLSTDQNFSGDAFRGTLEAPLIMNGAVIADRGSKVLGKVVSAEKAGRVKGVSELQLALTEINTTDGQRVQIQTASLDQQGQTGRAKDAAKVGSGAALGAIIGAIAGGGKGAGIGAGVGGAAGAGDVLLTRGKSVVLSTETKLNFHLSAPVSITERLN